MLNYFGAVEEMAGVTQIVVAGHHDVAGHHVVVRRTHWQNLAIV